MFHDDGYAIRVFVERDVKLLVGELFDGALGEAFLRLQHCDHIRENGGDGPGRVF